MAAKETRRERGEALYESGAVETKALGRELTSADGIALVKWGEFEVAGSSGEGYAVEYWKRYMGDDEVSCECRDAERLRRKGMWNTKKYFERISPDRYCKHVYAVLALVAAENKRATQEWRLRGDERAASNRVRRLQAPDAVLPASEATTEATTQKIAPKTACKQVAVF